MTLYIPTIPMPDLAVQEAVRERQLQLTKPIGALGVLEGLSLRLTAMTGQMTLSFPRKSVVVMAADHGVAAEGVSAYPAEVTQQMVVNMANGGAAVNVLARQAGATVTIVDIGVAADLPKHAHIHSYKVAYGTRNMAVGPALTLQEVVDAITVGMNVASQEIAQGVDLIAVGEMGIGNTTAAAAITAVILGLPVASVTGRGTGIDDERLADKVRVIEQAIALNKPDARDALDVLRCVGGLEIAGMAGVILGAAAGRVPILVDGFIASVAALVASELAFQVRPYLIAGHKSVEQGHMAILHRLGLRPLLDLEMRLGEGTGAVLAFHIVEAAARILNEMATFAEAGVSNKA